MSLSHYYELQITPQCEPELLAQFVDSLSDKGLELGDKSIILRDDKPLTQLQNEVETFCNSLNISVTFQNSKKQNSDWLELYKKSVQPIEVGKFYVRPSWNQPKKGYIDIIIDPALSFGSGHHATTYSCLKAISNYAKAQDSLLDVGCGSGILSIAAAKLEAKVHSCDTDLQAVESALSNFEQNNLQPSQAWSGSIDKTDKSYDVVVANIVADILIMLKKELKNRLKNNGTLILSGILDKKAQEVMQNFDDLQLIEKIEKDEWVTLIYRGVDEKL